METLIKLNTQSAGRDKIARLIQYSCRALWDTLEANKYSIDVVNRLKTVEYILSSFRKLLRFGLCIDTFYRAFQTINYSDATIRMTLTLSKIAQSLYLYTDHMIWLSRTGLFKNMDSKKWTELSNKFWLLSLIMNLLRDCYEILRLLDLYINDRQTVNQFLSVSSFGSCKLTSLSWRTYKLLNDHKDIVVDTIKNSCDVMIPLTSLGYTKLSPRTVGILGVISSLAGIIAIIQPMAKLVPA